MDARLKLINTRSQNTMSASYRRYFEDICKLEIFAIMCIKSEVTYVQFRALIYIYIK